MLRRDWVKALQGDNDPESIRGSGLNRLRRSRSTLTARLRGVARFNERANGSFDFFSGGRPVAYADPDDRLAAPGRTAAPAFAGGLNVFQRRGR